MAIGPRIEFIGPRPKAATPHGLTEYDMPVSAGTVAVLVSQHGRIPMTRRVGAPICVIDRAGPGPARWR